MTNILELLKNEKVEWKKIQDISKRIVSGGTPNRSNTEYYGGSIPWLRTQEVDFNEIHSTELYITEEGLENSSATLIAPNTIIVAMYGATAGKVALTKIPLTTNQACCNIEVNKELIKYRYVYYWLVNNYKVLKSMGQGSQSNINSTIIKNFPIPIPSLETQEKIVKILDKFTNYVTELQSELQSRTKQYTYYRDKLLSEEYLTKVTKEMGVDKKLNLVKLEEIANYCDGTHQTPKYQEKGIPFVSVENIKDLYGTKKYISEDDYKKYRYTPEKDDIFMTRIGDIGTCSVVQDNRDLAYYVTLALIKPNREIVDSKYLKLYIESGYGKRELNKRILHHATPIKVNLGDIGKIKVLIPPLHVQQHVVSILDKFDTLVNDIKEGLPKEIEQRQKQYGYWRECLLTFKD